jgi:hypothetical protein
VTEEKRKRKRRRKKKKNHTGRLVLENLILQAAHDAPEFNIFVRHSNLSFSLPSDSLDLTFTSKYIVREGRRENGCGNTRKINVC